jgi:hypothetical protein
MKLSVIIPCYNERATSLIRWSFPGGLQSDHMQKKRAEPTRLGKGPDPACFCRRRVSGWSARVNGAPAAFEQNGPFMSVWLNAGGSGVD